MAAARVYLFYGSDSRASSLAIQRWRRLFEEKYGSGTRYTIDADELSPAQCVSQLASYLEGQTLFSEPKLIIIKRLTSQERGKTATYSQAVIQAVKTYLTVIDSAVTVAFWEDKSLPSTHPLVQFFHQLVGEGVGKITLYTVAPATHIARQARTYLAELGLSLDEEGATWLTENYRRLEKQVRLERRLKSNEELLEDDRSWWLFQTLEGASLRAQGNRVSLKALESAQLVISQPVGVFDLVNCLAERNWSRVAQLLQELEKSNPDESFYFGLLAALNWQLKKIHSIKPEQRQTLSRLLVQIELLLKNTTLKPAWLFDLFFLRARALSQAGEVTGELISLRKLWLSQLPRS